MASAISDTSRQERIEKNRVCWATILADGDLAKLSYRIETNGMGQIIMTPPETGGHSNAQGEIAFQIRQILGGRTLPECPVSTTDGVKVADVGWYSEERFALVRDQQAFEIAPEICVEVLSPSNTPEEMKTKRHLYFEAGAEEVWSCDLSSIMHFYAAREPASRIVQSIRCPQFPGAIRD
jgi:Uma2 family endonuclease